MLLLCVLPTAALAQSAADVSAVKGVVKTAYVDGLYVNRDEAAMRRGFHPDFVMQYKQGAEVGEVSIDAWLEEMGLDGTPNENEITHSFDTVDVTGDAAFVKVQIYENGKHLYTDYFGMYRFSEGWKIVSKIYHGHS